MLDRTTWKQLICKGSDGRLLGSCSLEDQCLVLTYQGTPKLLFATDGLFSLRGCCYNLIVAFVNVLVIIWPD